MSTQFEAKRASAEGLSKAEMQDTLERVSAQAKAREIRSLLEERDARAAAGTLSENLATGYARSIHELRGRRVFLAEGIRQMVADKMGARLSSHFHYIFDQLEVN
ncbi:MAG: hypothetical protein ACK5MR_18200 [Cumulibacter sp.]